MKEVKGTLSHVRVTYRRARRWALRAHLGREAPGHARIRPSQEFNETHIPKDDRNAGGMPKVLELCIGSRVMLLRNIFTSQGLLNGALGHVEAIEYSEENVPSRIYVLFDDPNVGAMLQDCAHQNAIPIEMWD